MSATSTEQPDGPTTDEGTGSASDVGGASVAPVGGASTAAEPGHARAAAQPPFEAPQKLATVVALLLAVLGVGLVLWSNRGSSFYFDDWAFIGDRGDWSAGSLFGPQNQNWHVFTLLIYRALLAIWGLQTYVPERLAAAATLLAIGWLTYVYARRRIGPWWALGALLPVVVTSGAEIVLWPFQIGQLLSVATGLGALVLLDREEPRRTAAIIGAGALLMVSVASSSAGIPMLLLVLADGFFRAVRTTGSMRKPAVLAVAAGIPALLLYGWWYAAYGKDSPSAAGKDLGAVNNALRGAVDAGQAAVQRVFGLFDVPTVVAAGIIGQLAFAAVVVLVCARIFGPQRADRPRIIAIVAALVGYWFLLAWGRGSTPGFNTNSRYLFISQVLLVLLLVEIGASLRWQYQERAGIFAADRTRAVWRVACGFGVFVTVWAAFQASQIIRQEGYGFRVSGWATNGQNAAFGLLPAPMQPGAPYYLYPAGRSLPFPGALYQRALGHVDEQPPTEADLKAMPIESRQYADGYLLSVYAPIVDPSAVVPVPGVPPAIAAAPTNAAASMTVKARNKLGCTDVNSPGQQAVVTLPTDRPVTLQNTGTTDAWLEGHRYSPAVHPRANQQIQPGAVRRLELLPDGGSAPWTVQLRGNSLRICNAAPAQ